MERVSLGLFYINIKLNNDLINEIEFGLEEGFNYNYYHTWYKTQVHCFSLGFIYIYWRGFPIVDKKS